MTTRLHPIYKDVARLIAANQQAESRIFYSDKELAGLLEEELGGKEYQFAFMGLVAHLLEEYQIDFIRSENEVTGKGYKIATPEESLQITIDRLHRKQLKALNKQRRVIDTIDRSGLSVEQQMDYDRKIIRNSMLVSFYHKTPLSKCIPGAQIRVDVPRLFIEDKAEGKDGQDGKN